MITSFRSEIGTQNADTRAFLREVSQILGTSVISPNDLYIKIISSAKGDEEVSEVS